MVMEMCAGRAGWRGAVGIGQWKIEPECATYTLAATVAMLMRLFTR